MLNRTKANREDDDRRMRSESLRPPIYDVPVDDGC